MKSWIRSKFEPGAKFPWIASFIVAAIFFLLMGGLNKAGVLADGDVGYFGFTALSFPFTCWFWWTLGKAGREDAIKEQMK